MKNTSFFRQLLDDESYLENVTQRVNQPETSIKQVHRLAISLLLVCLHRQLQTDIGKGLVLRILEKHARLTASIPDFDLTITTDFVELVTEGHYLLSTLLPGKKSAIMTIIVQHTKLSFSDIDPIVGLFAYTLFTRLAFELINQEGTTSFMIPPAELEEFAPELSNKDYMAIGAYSVLSLSRPVSIATAGS
ncbi:hypothetical protein EXU85_25495 [Spirosoma sp. KCTC 42546]|uniref:hypothetical protein n=1 Tax=Spirosoma sp. KCTC 42546 TaxID=2520506 RepID=UPI001158EAB4|nr:hypothetical protein [Spirosoma sp. KCTC 42546]QDK81782.1 hypothetical protein EXU85_25495 [Spirosoma sp. KCTC 42546]